jgi:hypothetical protein
MLASLRRSLCALYFLHAVNVPGSYYTLSISGSSISVGQVTCPADTFSPGLKKQRACVPCPSGYTTEGVMGAVVPTQCGECHCQYTIHV